MLIADEYTKQLRELARKKIELHDRLVQDFYDRGGKITKFPPFTPGGMKVFSVSERPERKIVTTPKGIKVKLDEES